MSDQDTKQVPEVMSVAVMKWIGKGQKDLLVKTTDGRWLKFVNASPVMFEVTPR